MVSLQICAMFLALSAPSQTVLIDFRADYCGPCRAMDPTIEQLSARGYPVQRVNIDQNPALAQQYKVSSIPCFVLVVDGREVERVVGGRDISTLEGMFAKAGIQANAGSIASAGVQAKAIRPTSARDNSKSELAGGATSPPVINFPGQLSTAPLRTGGRSTFQNKSARSEAPEQDAPRDQALANSLIAATVRLRIEDTNGNSIGTGTIVDAREGMALVVTCGHVFRDSNGKGRIVAETFGASGSQRVEGRLLTFDLKSDVGLLTIPVSGQATVARVAPPEAPIAKGDRVVSVGCNHGEDPTARESAITNINRFTGSPNLQVAGEPVQGRSGGGLFNRDGQLIGVCNAADPTDHEGLYAALQAVHTALDGARLSFVYKTSERAAVAAGTRQPTGPAASAAAFAKSDRTVATPAVFDTAAASEAPSRMTAGEQAMLSDLREKSRNSQVIVVVRPLDDPSAQSQVVVLDKASPAFIQQLTADHPAQGNYQAFDAHADRDATVRR